MPNCLIRELEMGTLEKIFQQMHNKLIPTDSDLSVNNFLGDNKATQKNMAKVIIYGFQVLGVDLLPKSGSDCDWRRWLLSCPRTMGV